MNEQPAELTAPTLAVSQAEAADLVRAVDRNCTCDSLHPTCALHRLLRDQRALGGLVFARRALRDRLLVGEFGWILEIARDDPGWAPNVLGPRPAA